MQAQRSVDLRQLQQSLGQSWQLRPNQLQAQLHGNLPPLLLVSSTHLSPLFITKQGQVGRCRDVPLLKLRGAAHVHDRPLGPQERAHIEEGAGALHHC